MIKPSKCPKRWFCFFSLISIISFFSIASFAQTRYEDYSTSESIFIESFSNNKNSWITGLSADSCYSSKIENGVFEITSTCKDTRPWFCITRTIDITRDFEIEAEILYVQGEDDNSINLIWGKNDDDYKFRFGVSGNGQYRIDKYDGNWINLKNWTISDLVYKSGYNKLTARKIGAQYYFFLNEQLVHTSEFYPLFGNQIGFQDNQNSTMRINYLNVSYLKPDSKPALSESIQKDRSQSGELSGFGGSFGMGYIHSMGDIRELWGDGFDIDILFGYLFIPNFGFECGFNYGLTTIAEDKKIEVNVVDSYGNSSTRATEGGQYGSFPIGLKYTCPIFSSSKYFLTIGGGGEYYFENEWGMDDVTDYTSRGSSGFGYYAKISFTCLEDVGLGDYFGWGIQIKYISNHADVSDFYKNYGFNGETVSKSHVSDGRLILVLEMIWL
jgi:hypothetical protein